MGKVILFKNSNYDYTGEYRCYDIDESISKEYVLLYDDPNTYIEINSVLNIDTNYYVTLINNSRKYSKLENEYIQYNIFIHIKYDMYDIKSGVDFYEKRSITQFNRVVLSIRTKTLRLFSTLQNGTYIHIDTIDKFEVYDEGTIIPIASIENVLEYTSQGEEKFIQEYIEQEDCNVFPDFQECITLANEWSTYNENFSVQSPKCATPSLDLSSEQMNIENELKSKYMRLFDENRKLNETWSTSEQVIGVIFFLGVIMFLYVVYISL